MTRIETCAFFILSTSVNLFAADKVIEVEHKFNYSERLLTYSAKDQNGRLAFPKMPAQSFWVIGTITDVKITRDPISVVVENDLVYISCDHKHQSAPKVKRKIIVKYDAGRGYWDKLLIGSQICVGLTKTGELVEVLYPIKSNE